MKSECTIGLHLHEGIEETRRTIDGVLCYAAEHPELTIRDFNFLNDFTETRGLPPGQAV